MVRRAGRLRPVQVLRRLKKPFAIWPVIAWFARPFRRHSKQASGSSLSPRLRKPLPAWSLLIVLLLGVGLGYYGSTLLSQVEGTGTSIPDFYIAVTPASAIVSQGSFVSLTVQLSSLNSFAGSVNLNATTSPMITNATIALNPASASLLTGSASSTLTITIPLTAQVRTYSIMITGTSGRLYHEITAIVQVNLPPAPDFQLSANPASMNLTQGTSGTSTITLTSIGGFSGIVDLTVTSTPSSSSSPMLSVNPNRVTVLAGATTNVVLTISTSGTTARGSYSIVVQGIDGNLSNTVTVTLRVQ